MPILDGYFRGITTGETAVGTSAVPLSATSVPCGFVIVKARKTNTGSVFVGNGAVTAPDGTSDNTSGFELSAGEQSPPIPVANLTAASVIGSSGGQGVTYLAYIR